MKRLNLIFALILVALLLVNASDGAKVVHADDILDKFEPGKPVIAFGRGGAAESIRGVYPDQAIGDSSTGIFFQPQTREALIEAVRFFGSLRFEPELIRENALRFDRRVFRERIQRFVQAKFREHRESMS